MATLAGMTAIHVIRRGLPDAAQRKLRPSVAGLICAVLLFCSGGLSIAMDTRPDSPPAATDSPTATTSETNSVNALEATAAAPQDERIDSERRRKLRIALLTGGLIAITGLALVLLTILGGSATRRGLRRKPIKEPPPPLEAIPADRFDEPEPDDTERTAAANDDDPAQDGGTR